MSKAIEFLEAHKDIFLGGESDDYCPKCGNQMYVDDNDKNLLRCDKCGATRRVS